jgi:hypothetical protein
MEGEESPSKQTRRHAEAASIAGSSSAGTGASTSEHPDDGLQDKGTYIYERDEAEFSSTSEYKAYLEGVLKPMPTELMSKSKWGTLRKAVFAASAFAPSAFAPSRSSNSSCYFVLDWADYGDLGRVDAALPPCGDAVQMRRGKPYFEDHRMLRKCYFEGFSLARRRASEYGRGP